MRYVLFYESADDVSEAAPIHFPAHREYWRSFVATGTLLLIGPLEDPRDGAMAVFTTREAAETFARDDPFVVNGVVRRWHVRGWDEALTGR